MREIELTRGQVAIVDDEDFAFLDQWTWFAKRRTGRSAGSFFAVRSVYVPTTGKQKTVYMQRVVLERKLGRHQQGGCKPGFINGNSLDLRRENLIEVPTSS